QMHERMQRCFDWFLPEVVPPNVIEQYRVNRGDILFMCCDGLGDWIAPEHILEALMAHGIQDGTDMLMRQAKEVSLAAESVYDDITAVALQCL
ncbi:MAG TPA: hypothetical protein PKE04_07930, partial [Clostridia bacterium]|nr:hypothetical protein [Clostridia bacterium]